MSGSDNQWRDRIALQASKGASASNVVSAMKLNGQRFAEDTGAVLSNVLLPSYFSCIRLYDGHVAVTPRHICLPSITEGG